MNEETHTKKNNNKEFETVDALRGVSLLSPCKCRIQFKTMQHNTGPAIQQAIPRFQVRQCQIYTRSQLITHNF